MLAVSDQHTTINHGLPFLPVPSVGAGPDWSSLWALEGISVDAVRSLTVVPCGTDNNMVPMTATC